jgi:hypothetical protein
MEKEKVVKSSSSSNEVTTAAEQLKASYQNFLNESAKLFPKVDQKLLLDILQFETNYKDWEGNVLLKIVYDSNADIDTDQKKEMIFQRYQKMPNYIVEDRSLRVLVRRMYVNELEKLLKSDNDIVYVYGSATLSPTDSYSDSAA